MTDIQNETPNNMDEIKKNWTVNPKTGVYTHKDGLSIIYNPALKRLVINNYDTWRENAYQTLGDLKAVDEQFKRLQAEFKLMQQEVALAAFQKKMNPRSL